MAGHGLSGSSWINPVRARANSQRSLQEAEQRMMTVLATQGRQTRFNFHRSSPNKGSTFSNTSLKNRDSARPLNPIRSLRVASRQVRENGWISRAIRCSPYRCHVSGPGWFRLMRTIFEFFFCQERAVTRLVCRQKGVLKLRHQRTEDRTASFSPVPESRSVFLFLMNVGRFSNDRPISSASARAPDLWHKVILQLEENTHRTIKTVRIHRKSQIQPGQRVWKDRNLEAAPCSAITNEICPQTRQSIILASSALDLWLANMNHAL